MKFWKFIKALLLVSAIALSASVASAASVKTLKQTDAEEVTLKIEALADENYIIEVFADGVDGEEWTPGVDSENKAKELVYVAQGKADSDGDIEITFNIKDADGEYSLRYSVGSEIDVKNFEMDKDFNKDDGYDDDDTSSTPDRRPSSSGGGSSKNNSKPIALPVVSNDPIEEMPFDIYSDLEDAIWARNAIVNLSNKGIISGRGGNIFAPNETVTREEFAKMLVGAFAKDAQETKELSFLDVKKNEWYYEYIQKAVASGIVTGYSETEFGIGDNITREDMAVMTYRAAGFSKTSDAEKTKFADDNLISDYAKAAVLTMSEKGIINGKGNNLFCPKDNATRAEAAKIVYETMQLVF